LLNTEFAGSLNTVSISDAAGTNSPPTAIFTYTQDGDTFIFDASGSYDSDGSIVEYTWDFGNGSVDAGVTASLQNIAGTDFPFTNKLQGLPVEHYFIGAWTPCLRQH